MLECYMVEAATKDKCFSKNAMNWTRKKKTMHIVRRGRNLVLSFLDFKFKCICDSTTYYSAFWWEFEEIHGSINTTTNYHLKYQKQYVRYKYTYSVCTMRHNLKFERITWKICKWQLLFLLKLDLIKCLNDVQEW